MMLEFETSQVGDFADSARSTIDFAMSPASLSDRIVIRFDMVYHTTYLCTVRWPYVHIAVSGLTTNYISNDYHYMFLLL